MIVFLGGSIVCGFAAPPDAAKLGRHRQGLPVRQAG
jgi:hypothetical protein